MKAYGQVKGRNYGDGQKIIEKSAGRGCGQSLREQFEEQQRRAKKVFGNTGKYNDIIKSAVANSVDQNPKRKKSDRKNVK